MSQQTFQVFLCAMGLTALFVFIALYFIKAGYGMFRTASWGVSIDNKSAWILMESPVFFSAFTIFAEDRMQFFFAAGKPARIDLDSRRLKNE